MPSREFYLSGAIIGPGSYESASCQSSGESARKRRLARVFAAHIHKVGMQMKAQTKRQTSLSFSGKVSMDVLKEAFVHIRYVPKSLTV